MSGDVYDQLYEAAYEDGRQAALFDARLALVRAGMGPGTQAYEILVTVERRTSVERTTASR